MDTPKFVKYIGDGEAGLKNGDVVKVLSRGSGDRFYVECPNKSMYHGDTATNPSALEGKNFTYLNDEEYELIKEEKKMENQNGNICKFKVGDIVCGNSDKVSGITNTDMTKGEVVKVYEGGRIKVNIVEHTNQNFIGKEFFVYPEYFDLVTSSSPYHITTDMKTFVEIEHENHKTKSKCNVQFDDFNLHTGIDIAMERLNEIENPKKPELPKYVRYIGNGTDGGLKNGDICRVLCRAFNCIHEGTLYVASPNPTGFSNTNSENPSVLKGKNFTYLWPNQYEPVDFEIYG